MSRTVRKIGPILDLFTVEHPEWGAREIADEIGLPRSSVHELLASLVEIGLLRTAERGRYRIGWRPLELGDALRSTSDLQVAAAPAMDELARNVGETVQLAVHHRGRVLQIDTVPGRRPVTVVAPPVGRNLPTHSTALGKVLLAGMDRSTVRSNLRSDTLPHITACTVTDVESIVAEIEDVRERHFAVELEENETGVCGTAAPVTDDAGSVIAALGILLPSDRFERRQHDLVRSVTDAADSASTRLAQLVPRI